MEEKNQDQPRAATQEALIVRRAEAMLELPRLAEHLAEKEFLQKALEIIEDVTSSQISFLHFVNDDEESIELVTWSHRTLDYYCHAVYDRHYPVAQAGIWADALRQKKPVVFNDYPCYPHKRGLPDGHAELNRLISVPVLNEGKTVMLMGVGNKPYDYDVTDVETVQLLSNAIWNMAQRRRYLIALQQKEQLFRATFEQAAVGLAQVSLRGEFILINQRFCQIIGYELEELMSLHLGDITHPEDFSLTWIAFQSLLDHKKPSNSHEQRYIRKDGTIIWINLTVSLVQRNGEPPDYFIVAFVDISDRKLAEYQLNQLNQELETKIVERTQKLQQLSTLQQAILDGADYSIISTDLTGIIQTFNKAAERMLGYSAAEIIGRVTPAILHDSQEIEERAILLSQELGYPVAQSFECIVIKAVQGLIHEEQWTYIRKDGSRFPVLLSISAMHNSEGRIIGFLTIAKDITQSKRAEEEKQLLLKNLSKTVQELEERNQDILLLNSLNEFLQACNNVQEAYQVLPQLLGTLFVDCSSCLFRINTDNNYAEKVAEWGNPPTKASFLLEECWGIRRCHLHYVGKKSPKLVCQHLLSPTDVSTSLCVPLMAQGKTRGLLFISSNNDNVLNTAKQQIAKTLAENISLILSNLELRENLEFQSIRDPLTGLYNRRYWEEALEREIKLAQRRKTSLSIIMVDIDYFKHFNDTFGHKIGDYVLQQISQFLIQNCRRTDLVCRYGGEEFLLILPECQLQDAYKQAQKLCQKIKQLTLIPEKSTRSPLNLGCLTASFGLATYPELIQRENELLSAADQALFQAKKQGRDRVVVYE